MLIFDPAVMTRAIVADLQAGAMPARSAPVFIRTLAWMVARSARRLRAAQRHEAGGPLRRGVSEPLLTERVVAAA